VHRWHSFSLVGFEKLCQPSKKNQSCFLYKSIFLLEKAVPRLQKKLRPIQKNLGEVLSNFAQFNFGVLRLEALRLICEAD
jgi:hypothetical protein